MKYESIRTNKQTVVSINTDELLRHVVKFDRLDRVCMSMLETDVYFGQIQYRICSIRYSGLQQLQLSVCVCGIANSQKETRTSGTRHSTNNV